MNPRRLPLPLLLCVAGFAGGFAAKKLRTGGPAHPEVAAPAFPQSPTGVSRKASDRGDAATALLQAAASGLHSTDTAESLLTAPDAEAYRRVALWLVDASPDQIWTFWMLLQEKSGWHSPVENLVLLVWTRVDLPGALAAATETGYDSEAWSMWAVNDPEASMAAARGENAHFMEDILSGLAKYRPAWLRAHLSGFPKELQWRAFSDPPAFGLDGDPAEVLDFVRKNNEDLDESIYAEFVAADPLAAYQWILRHPECDWKDLQSTRALRELAAKDPGELQRMAAEAVSGKTRRQMESALFTRLLETDPQAALAQANATTAPLVAAQRLSEVAAKRVVSNPAQARELVDRVFSINPGFPIEQDLKAVVSRLVKEDPQAMLSLPSVQKSLVEDSAPTRFDSLAREWLAQDQAALVEWTGQQAAASPARNIASKAISRQLSNQGDDEAAANWAQETASDGPGLALVDALIAWRKKDREAAARWLEASSLSGPRKQQFSWIFSSP